MCSAGTKCMAMGRPRLEPTCEHESRQRGIHRRRCGSRLPAWCKHPQGRLWCQVRELLSQVVSWWPPAVLIRDVLGIEPDAHGVFVILHGNQLGVSLRGEGM